MKFKLGDKVLDRCTGEASIIDSVDTYMNGLTIVYFDRGQSCTLDCLETHYIHEGEINMKLGDFVKNVNTNKVSEIIGIENYKDGVSCHIIYSLSDGSRWADDFFVPNHIVTTRSISVDKSDLNIKQICVDIKTMQFEQKNYGTAPAFNHGYYNGLEYALAKLEKRATEYLDEEDFVRGHASDKPRHFDTKMVCDLVREERDAFSAPARTDPIAAERYNALERVLAKFENREPKYVSADSSTKPLLFRSDVCNMIREMRDKVGIAAGTNSICAAKRNALEDVLAKLENRGAHYIYPSPVAADSYTTPLRFSVDGTIGIGNVAKKDIDVTTSVPKPQKTKNVSIAWQDETNYMIRFYADPRLALKLQEFGNVRKEDETDEFRLKVDRRYEFKKVLEYIQSL